MKQQLETIRQAAMAALDKAATPAELEDLRVKLLGKKGELTAVLKQMGKLSAEERPVMGQLANNVRAAIEEKLEQRKAAVHAAVLEAKLASEKGARKPSEPKSSPSDREQAMEAIAKGDYPAAEALIERMLQAKPNGAAALNMRAAMEAKRGNFKAAESALNQAITSNPRNHFAYYNMAHLMLQVKSDNKRIARRYYETGREVGGPVDERLEEAFK